MLLSPRKNGLDSLLKEVRVFKVWKSQSAPQNRSRIASTSVEFIRLPQKECGKRSSHHFFPLRSLFGHLFWDSFCQTPFARLLLPDSFCQTPFAAVLKISVEVAAISNPPRAQRLKKIQSNLDCKLQPSEFPTKVVVVGGALEIFNLAWNVQFRRQILNFVNLWALSQEPRKGGF